jgi:tRNA nucleotidyltransferase/poly(A) polymerase
VSKEKIQIKKKTPAVLLENLGEVEKLILADPIIRQVAGVARRKGISLYLVGGVIRDMLLGRRVKDYDFVVQEVEMTFLDELGDLLEASVFPMGKGRQEQVYRLAQGEKVIDFTVMAGDDIDQDLMRRDFTINAIAYSFAEERFFAHPRAMEDLKAGRINLVSPHALQADPLRMLRAIRYQCTLHGFDVDAPLQEEISRYPSLLGDVAPERIKAELDEIILSPAPAQGLLLMRELELLVSIFPELAPLGGLPQGRHHATDALSHTIEIVAEVSRFAREGNPFPFCPSEQERLILGYAALFHDLGKPAAQSIDEQGEIHFYGHPEHSSRLAQEIMQRLKFTNKIREGVVLLVENHMRILTLAQGAPQDKALRRLINALGEEIRLLLLLGLAETGFKTTIEDDEQGRFLSLCQRIWDLYKREDLIKPEPLLKGRDLLARGYAPGPRMGEILDEVEKRQIAGELRNKEEALQFVKEQYAL